MVLAELIFWKLKLVEAVVGVWRFNVVCSLTSSKFSSESRLDELFAQRVVVTFTSSDSVGGKDMKGGWGENRELLWSSL